MEKFLALITPSLPLDLVYCVYQSIKRGLPLPCRVSPLKGSLRQRKSSCYVGGFFVAEPFTSTLFGSVILSQ